MTEFPGQTVCWKDLRDLLAVQGRIARARTARGTRAQLEDELILRLSRARATLTLQAPGAEPRVFELAGGADSTALSLIALELTEDSRLPAARCLPGLETLCMPALAGIDFDLPGTVLAYRPGSRAVLRRRSRAAETYYFKILTTRAAQRAAKVFSALTAKHGLLRLALPCAQNLEQGIFVSRSLAGEALCGMLRRDVALDAARIAQALAVWAELELPEDLPMRSIEDERRSACKQLRTAACLRSGRSYALLAERLQDLELLQSRRKPALLHTDLHDKQIFVGPDEIGLLDLEGASRGDRRLDLVNLLTHLELRVLQQGLAGRPGMAAQKLKDELVRHTKLELDDAYVRQLRALVLARLSGVYAARSTGQALAAMLLSRAQEALR